MNLLYLIKQPLLRRDFDRFGITHFLNKGYRVTILDLSDLIHPELPNIQNESLDNANILIKKIKTLLELKAEKNIFATSDLVIALIQSFGLSKELYPIFKLIAETKRPYLVQLAPRYPGKSLDASKQNIVGRVRDYLTRIKRIRPITSILKRLPSHWVGIPVSNYAILCNGTYRGGNNLVGIGTKLINAHMHDFDIFLKESKKAPTKKEQVVFIDQHAPFHVDFLQMKVPLIDPDKYFFHMRTFFERIEREFGFKVVIAAHPRADYRQTPHFFGNRPVFYNQTARLIIESRLVIAHNSNSISYAIMAKKPVILVTTNELYKTAEYEKHYYDGLSSELGIPLLFIDAPEELDLRRSMSVDEARYQRYLETYVKTPHSISKLLWEIVDDEITNKYQKTKIYNRA